MPRKHSNSSQQEAGSGLLLLFGAVVLLFAMSSGGQPVQPSPITTQKVVAFIRYDGSPQGYSRLTKGQQEIIQSTAPNSFKATITAAGGEYRFLDKDNKNLANDAYWVQEASKRAKDLDQFFFVANGKKFSEGPLPATPAAAIAVLKKVGVQ